MRTVEFRHLLDDQNALRVRFDMERDIVVRFAVQLECVFDETWHPVVRYDTAHGFAHRDLLRPHGDAEKTALPVADFNAGLTYAMDDLRENWATYRRRYEEWLQRR